MRPLNSAIITGPYDKTAGVRIFYFIVFIPIRVRSSNNNITTGLGPSAGQTIISFLDVLESSVSQTFLPLEQLFEFTKNLKTQPSPSICCKTDDLFFYL